MRGRRQKAERELRVRRVVAVVGGEELGECSWKVGRESYSPARRAAPARRREASSKSSPKGVEGRGRGECAGEDGEENPRLGVVGRDLSGFPIDRAAHAIRFSARLLHSVLRVEKREVRGRKGSWRKISQRAAFRRELYFSRFFRRRRCSHPTVESKLAKRKCNRIKHKIRITSIGVNKRRQDEEMRAA